MKILPIILVLLIIIFLATGGVLLWVWQEGQMSATINNLPGPNPNPQPNQQSVSDGTITFAYDPSDFGLATNQTQILAHAYIPPCDATFNYCLYYTGSAYAGTNFESAGLRIQKRTDLTAERLCLQTPPEGFDASKTPDNSNSYDTYSMSAFNNIGQGAAGHLAQGSLYRLYVRQDGSCYEFETRVGQTQFANYPAGTIQEFTADKQAQITAKLKDIVSGVTLSSGQQTTLP